MKNRDFILIGIGFIAGIWLTSRYLKSKKAFDSDAEQFSFPDGSIKLGDKGTDVIKMKEVLGGFGFETDYDGLYDRKTKSIVLRAFNNTKVMNNRNNDGQVDKRFINDCKRIMLNQNPEK